MVRYLTMGPDRWGVSQGWYPIDYWSKVHDWDPWPGTEGRELDCPVVAVEIVVEVATHQYLSSHVGSDGRTYNHIPPASIKAVRSESRASRLSDRDSRRSRTAWWRFVSIAVVRSGTRRT